MVEQNITMSKQQNNITASIFHRALEIVGDQRNRFPAN